MPITGHTAIVMTLNSITAPAVDEWFGYAFHETAGAAGTVLFKDGTSTGALLWPVRVGANASKGQVWPIPMKVSSGVLYVDSTGAITGTVFV